MFTRLGTWHPKTINLGLIRDGPDGNDGGQRSSDIYGQSVRMGGNFTCEQTKLPNNGWHDLNKKHVNNHDQNDDDNEVHFDVIYLQE